MSPRPPRARRLLSVIAVCSTALLLAACAPTVALDPAPDANDPKCADISVHLPDAVAGQAQRQTNAQATGAWGDPAVVLLRCGVKPIGPTSKPCVSVNGIDWVLENDPDAKTGLYITFGRLPATEVVIDRGSHRVTDSGVLPDLADAISQVPQQKSMRCQGLSDGSIPTATPSPSPAR